MGRHSGLRADQRSQHRGVLCPTSYAHRTRSRLLIPVDPLVLSERLAILRDADGSRGTFRAPLSNHALDARDDYQAVNPWLSMHESTAP